MPQDADLLTLTAKVVASYLARNKLQASDLPNLIARTYEALSGLGASTDPSGEPGPAAAPEPAVSVRKSLASPDHILSLIDGKPYKALKRHLAANGLTPEQYRERYGLKADYPMVAPAYSEHRRQVAISLQLGRKRGIDPGPLALKPEQAPVITEIEPAVDSEPQTVAETKPAAPRRRQRRPKAAVPEEA